MNQLKEWYSRYKDKLKFIFIASVLVLIITEIVIISKSISHDELVSVFSKLSTWRILAMFLLGLAAVLPMIGYDLILEKIIGEKFSKRYLLENSFTINSLNNVVGLGGIISVGLRSTLFGKDVGKEKIADGVSKVFLFTMSGLSIYSLISLVNLFAVQGDRYLEKYWVWLVLGSLYFPGVMIITSLNNKKFVSGFSLQLKLQIVLTSFLEWSGVLIAFLGTGYLMGIHISITRIIPLFIVATVIGIVSLIPGELGSFDVIMIFGLTAMGHNRAEVVAWILLYRLFYYFIPFFIGVFFFLKNTGNSINKRFEGIPLELSKSVAHKILVFLLYFSGIIMVLSATIPEVFSQYTLLDKIDILSVRFISETPSLIVGFLLLAVARGMASKVKKAFYPTIILLVVAFSYSLFKNFSWGLSLLLVFLFIFVRFSRGELYREQFVYSWEMLTVDGIIYAVLSILYIVIGLYNSPKVIHQHVHNFLLFPSEKVWFYGLFTIVVVSFFVYLFFRYLSFPNQKMGMLVDDERVLSVLNTYGGDENSQLVFLGDKDIYIYQNDDGEDTVVFQFQTYNNKCMIMGMPFGKKADFQEAIKEFMTVADIYGYQLLFYEVQAELITFLHEYGFDFIKMGEEAHVYLPDFSIKGKKNRGSRALMNRYERDEYQFEVVHPPYTELFMTELKQVSDNWLGSRKEKGYSLGFFSEDYLKRAPIAIVRDKNGTLVGFANIMPTYDKEQATIDLMRYSKDAPPGVMDYLFISLFEYTREEGYDYFNLGMAPLANVGTSKSSFIQERAAYLIYNFSTKFYSFQGLRDYKQKFVSKWIPKYTLYSRNSSLVYSMIQLMIINAKVINLSDIEEIKKTKYVDTKKSIKSSDDTDQ